MTEEERAGREEKQVQNVPRKWLDSVQGIGARHFPAVWVRRRS